MKWPVCLQTNTIWPLKCLSSVPCMVVEAGIPSDKFVSKKRQRGTGYIGANLLSRHNLLHATRA